MRNLKNVKVGDILELNKMDRIFVIACFESSTKLEAAAIRLLDRSQDETRKAWQNIRLKWPELNEFNLGFREGKYLVITDK